MCPKGNDVMDTRLDTSDKLVYQIQNITLYAGVDGDATDLTAAGLYKSNSTFALTFKSTLNESYTTIPIVFNPWKYTTARNHGKRLQMAYDIELALEALPNYVIDEVSVNATAPTGGESVFVQVSFVGTTVQGPQNLLMVEWEECGDGCTPKVAGLDLNSYTDPQLSFVTELKPADYNNYECGRRGKCDYDTGVCDCFEGYTGLQCQIQTSLM